MSDLVTFLRARLDEDEAAAEGAVGHVVNIGSALSGVAVLRHINRWTSARVLAEVEAKRAVVDIGPSWCGGYREPGDRSEWYADHYPDHQAYPCDGCSAAETGDRQWLYVLRCLATPYADHPDYREEWRP